MKPLSGLDATFLYLETPETPMHVGSLHLYRLPEGFAGDYFAAACRHVASRLHLAAIFRRRLATLPLQVASPMWVETDDVDLEWHMQRLRLPRPGTQAQLEAAVARLHAVPLERDRPLWRFYIIEGLSSGDVAWYSKIHHAALDGAAGVALAAALLDPTPKAPPARAPHAARRERAPGLKALFGAAFSNTASQYVKLVRSLPDVGRLLAGIASPAGASMRGAARSLVAFAPRTPLNVPITAERSFATASIPLDEVKRVAARHEAKVNDVVLAMASGALRRYLAHHGGIPTRPMIAAVPVSLRASGDTEYTTQATMTLASLATNLSDPVARLAAIRASAGAAKALTAGARSVIPTDFPSLFTPWLLSAAARLYGGVQRVEPFPPLANVVISNVPGPQSPLYLAGARMLTYWPASIVEHGLGLNITVQSYCGSLDFGVMAASKAVPDARLVARALLEAHAELLALEASSGTATAERKARAAKRPREPTKPRKRAAQPAIARSPARRGGGLGK
jgi:WS/DGAT/MGAT family acyltransferase